ncbi:MAG: phenylphosphate carboxylase subunit delta, partial [Planctomycetales bacterium]|nr:phenylphosphate carboxylase subunit delta [Planctomycetales bacterium]
FFVRDGMGIRLWQRAGYKFGMITARSSHIVKVRAAELGVDLIRQGFDDKLPVAEQIVEQLDLQLENVCYVGDDLTDVL